MKKKFKKIIAGVIAVVLSLAISMTAFAGSFEVGTDSPYGTGIWCLGYVYCSRCNSIELVADVRNQNGSRRNGLYRVGANVTHYTTFQWHTKTSNQITGNDYYYYPVDATIITPMWWAIAYGGSYTRYTLDDAIYDWCSANGCNTSANRNTLKNEIVNIDGYWETGGQAGDSYRKDAYHYFAGYSEEEMKPLIAPPSYSHTLYYNANGGSGGAGTQSATHTSANHTFTVSGSYPSRTGYSFAGWWDGSYGYWGGNGITVGANSSKTLYAGWNANNYTNTLYFNGGSVVEFYTKI